MDADEQALRYAHRWCESRGNAWRVKSMLGRGGTAPVFLVDSPSGPRALKLLDEKFSTGELGRQTKLRIERQVALGDHGCPNLVVCHDGGEFEDRLYLLMDCAEGQELEKRLPDIPRNRIRQIVHQIAKAAIFLRSQGLSHRDIKSANVFISDDNEKAVLLDLSVIREINDPVGLGTDHDNQLPVVATSRYTPPEYLFRLQEPSPELWHGVDIYQLGGLLHDLIMREPMFSDEYAASSENRYRFAWIVATVDPKVSSEEVDADLIFLSRRALDKNWDRRRQLRLENFLIATDQHSASLAALGLNTPARPSIDITSGLRPGIARELARAVDQAVATNLKAQGVTATHRPENSGDDLCWQISWQWSNDAATPVKKVVLKASLQLIPSSPIPEVQGALNIDIDLEVGQRTASTYLPKVSLQDGAADELARLIIASLGLLSSEALSAEQGN